MVALSQSRSSNLYFLVRLAFTYGRLAAQAMFHTVTGAMPDGSVERHTSRLLDFGEPGARACVLCER